MLRANINKFSCKLIPFVKNRSVWNKTEHLDRYQERELWLKSVLRSFCGHLGTIFATKLLLESTETIVNWF